MEVRWSAVDGQRGRAKVKLGQRVRLLESVRGKGARVWDTYPLVACNLVLAYIL
jgi:hypothetical protein